MWDSLYFLSKYSPDQFLEKQRYYELCREVLHTHKFDSARDKKIWTMHTDGLSYTQIMQQVKISRGWISAIINKVRNETMCRGRQSESAG